MCSVISESGPRSREAFLKGRQWGPEQERGLPLQAPTCARTVPAAAPEYPPAQEKPVPGRGQPAPHQLCLCFPGRRMAAGTQAR